MFDFDYLRKTYPFFIYHGYDIIKKQNSIDVKYHFEIKGLSDFYPEWSFPYVSNNNEYNSILLDNLVFSLGMVELVSYWKATCSPYVMIKPHTITDEMSVWWKNLYFDGLGEFFYKNNIKTSVTDFMSLSSEGTFTAPFDGDLQLSGSLIPVGGGKDSAVTLALLKEMSYEIMPYIINEREATKLTCEVAGYGIENRYLVKRTIDRKLIELNSQGFLNGHTPFSAIVAFSSIISALISSKKYVVLSNESSANESTVLGDSVNHQFSKSEEFERNFIEYEKKYINSGVSYFSFLRPLSEIQIAMLFSKFKEFHQVFKSCNVGSKKDIWCCSCPKCLFVYIILSPFLTQSELVSIFGENLLDKKELLNVFKQLTGLLPNKPFECVGSRDEVIVALAETLKKYVNKSEAPYLLKVFEDSSLKSDRTLNDYVNFFDGCNHIPDKFVKLLVEKMKEQLGYVPKN